MPRRIAANSDAGAHAPGACSGVTRAARRKPCTGAASQPSQGAVSAALPSEQVSASERAIAEAAYFIAESEGFPFGRALDHWLIAEARLAGCADGSCKPEAPEPGDRPH